MLPVVTLCGLPARHGRRIFLLLHRSILRVALGLGCLSHAVHFVVLSGGRWGSRAPAGQGRGTALRTSAIPSPRPFVLTAIVIALAFTLYLLGLEWPPRHEAEDAPELAPPPEW